MPAVVELDRSLILLLREPGDVSDALGPEWFEEAAAEFTALGGYTVLSTIGIVALTVLWLLRKRAAALFLATAVLSGTVVSSLLKHLFDRPRPDIVDHMDQVFTNSFPSGHSMIGMVAWLTLAAVVVRFVPTHALRVFLLATAFTFGLLIGISRVYLGVHWPTDVVAGWCLGIAWAGSCWLVAHHIEKARGPGDEELGHSRG